METDGNQRYVLMWGSPDLKIFPSNNGFTMLNCYHGMVNNNNNNNKMTLLEPNGIWDDKHEDTFFSLSLTHWSNNGLVESMVEGTGCTGSSDKWCLPAAAADGADPSQPAAVSRLLPFSIRQIIITSDFYFFIFFCQPPPTIFHQTDHHHSWFLFFYL